VRSLPAALCIGRGATFVCLRWSSTSPRHGTSGLRWPSYACSAPPPEIDPVRLVLPRGSATAPASIPPAAGSALPDRRRPLVMCRLYEKSAPRGDGVRRRSDRTSTAPRIERLRRAAAGVRNWPRLYRMRLSRPSTRPREMPSPAIVHNGSLQSLGRLTRKSRLEALWFH
jgi:hypothetical protein